eukprot:scaffold136169_cov76-Cyclotella_meneghiniana.AAC.1
MTRERDKVFMELVVRKMDRSDGVGVNRMRKKMKVYLFSQLSYCDGLTVKNTVIQGGEAEPSTIEFSYEEPTSSDRRLWQKALRTLTSVNYRFQIPLGYSTRLPYDRFVWFTTVDRQRLLCVDQASMMSTLYLPSASHRRTRQSALYQDTGRSDSLSCMYTQFASVQASSSGG